MEEFSALPPGEVENEEYRQMDLKWQAERQKEFQEIMDLDHNGKVDLKELRVLNRHKFFIFLLFAFACLLYP